MATLADILRQTGYAQDGNLAAPASVEPTMTSILQKHIASLPQQLATNQAALDSAIGSWNKTDFGTGQPNANYRPEAMQELTQLMPNVMGATAWHGTPHKIQGQFDINKVGTGEGAQAYGHGMYFAESPKVANEYSKMMPAGGSQPSPKRALFGQEVEPLTSEYKAAQLVEEMGVSKAKKFVNDWAKNPTPDQVDFVQGVQNAINGITKKSNVKNLGTGNLYKVDIPDEHIPNMLDWDKPLSQQSDVVRQALGLPEDKFAGFKVPATGTNYSFSPKMTGAEFYKELTDLAKTQAGASEMLNSMGVKGIRYLDEGSRAKGGTSNFVVFDPSTVKILKENGKPLSRKELIENQVKDLK